MQYVSQYQAPQFLNLVDHLSRLQLILIPTCHIYTLVGNKNKHSNDQDKENNYSRVFKLRVSTTFLPYFENSHRFSLSLNNGSNHRGKNILLSSLSVSKKPPKHGGNLPELGGVYFQETVFAAKNNSHDFHRCKFFIRPSKAHIKSDSQLILEIFLECNVYQREHRYVYVCTMEGEADSTRRRERRTR